MPMLVPTWHDEQITRLSANGCIPDEGLTGSLHD
jgi:hypothetical protein